MCPAKCLHVHVRIPVVVKDEHGVCRCKIDAETPCILFNTMLVLPISSCKPARVLSRNTNTSDLSLLKSRMLSSRSASSVLPSSLRTPNGDMKTERDVVREPCQLVLAVRQEILNNVQHVSHLLRVRTNKMAILTTHLGEDQYAMCRQLQLGKHPVQNLQLARCVDQETHCFVLRGKYACGKKSVCRVLDQPHCRFQALRRETSMGGLPPCAAEADTSLIQMSTSQHICAYLEWNGDKRA